jgi:hypothetical protein
MKTLITIVMLLISLLARAQVSEQWAKRFSGHLGAVCKETAVDNSGNVYVTGKAVISGESSNYCTIKYSSSGTELWVKFYNGPVNGADEPQDIAVDNNGNVYVTGRSEGAAGQDMCTVKYDPAGAEQWVRRKPGYANSVALDNASNVYIGGAYFVLPGVTDMAVVKYDPAGNEIMMGAYNGAPEPLQDVANDIVIDNSGNIFAAGSSGLRGSNGSVTSRYLVVKFSPLGDTLWNAKYNGSGFGDDFAKDIEMDYAGNIYVTGQAIDSAAGPDITTIKYSSAGGFIWLRAYDGGAGSPDDAVSLSVNASGDVFVAGRIAPMPSSGSEMCLLKYNTSGTPGWVKTHGGSSNADDFGVECRADNSGGCYITGITAESSPSSFDYTTIKYNSAGVQVWMIRYNGGTSFADLPAGLEADNLGNLYVTGTSSSHFLTVKYGDATGIINIPASVPEGYSLGQNYPNPFNPATNFEFRIADPGHVSVKVYDINGREMRALVNEFLKAGTYNYTFDGTGLNSGVYFYTLQAGGYKETKKMLLLK